MSEPRSEWTLNSLHALLTREIASLEKRMDERFEGSDKFHSTSLEQADKRYQQRFEDSQDAVKTAFATAREALQEAKAASAAGFEKSNEWRSSLNDIVRTRLGREEYEPEHRALADKVEALVSRLDIYQGARPLADKGNWRDILSVISIIVAAATAILVTITHHPV